MKINYLRQYRKKGTGALTFVYTVEGTKEQKAAYKKSKGENYREDEGKHPLFFTTRFVGKSSQLIKTQDGQFVADTTRDDQVLNLISQGYTQEMAERMVAGTAVAAAPADEETE